MANIPDASKRVDLSFDDANVTAPLITPSGVDRGKGFTERCIGWVLHAPRLAYNSGVVCCIGGQLFFAIMITIAKLLYENGIPVFETLLIRNTFVAILCGTVLKCAQQSSFVGPRECWSLLAVNAVAGGVSNIIFNTAVTLIDIGDATALSKVVPIFTVLMSAIMCWEVPNVLMVVGSILCCAGAVAVAHPPFLFGGDQVWDLNHILGGSLSVGTAVLRAILFLTVGKMGTKTSGFLVTMCVATLRVVVLPIPLALSFPSPPVFRITWQNALLLLADAFIAFFGMFSVLRGAQLCDGVKASSLSTSAIIFSYLLGLIALNEKPTLYAMIGTAVLIAGICTVSVGKARALRAKSAAETDDDLTRLLCQNTQKTETGVEPRDPEGGENAL